MSFRRIFSRRTIPGFLLLAGLLAVMTQPGNALAAFGTCRTDPTVVLSNGAVVTMYADIQDDISDVQNVNYVLHVPSDASVQSIAYDQSGSVETVQVLADQGPGNYTTTTVVTTGAYHVNVDVTTSISGVPCKHSTFTKNGWAGYPVPEYFSC